MLDMHSQNTVDIMGPVHSDIFFQDCLILTRVNLRLKLNRAKSSFCLVPSVPGATFKVAITEAILYVRKVKVVSSITLGHAAALKANYYHVPYPSSGLQSSLHPNQIQ